MEKVSKYLKYILKKNSLKYKKNFKNWKYFEEYIFF